MTLPPSSREWPNPEDCLAFYELLWNIACAKGVLKPSHKNALRIPKLFVGRYDSKVYCGGRICISSEWRAKLNGDSLVAACDVTKPNAVSFMPESLYEKELVAMQDKDYPEEERAALLAAKRLRLDVRSRVKLPDELLRLVGGGGRVTLIGCIGEIRVIPFIKPIVTDEDALSAALADAFRN